MNSDVILWIGDVVAILVLIAIVCFEKYIRSKEL